MLKAMMPVLVFAVGCLLKTEKFSWGLFGNMVVVTIGVLIASYGEIEFVMFGFLLQILSLVFESTRLALVQILLQKRGLKLNPILPTTSRLPSGSVAPYILENIKPL